MATLSLAAGNTWTMLSIRSLSLTEVAEMQVLLIHVALRALIGVPIRPERGLGRVEGTVNSTALHRSRRRIAGVAVSPFGDRQPAVSTLDLYCFTDHVDICASGGTCNGGMLDGSNRSICTVTRRDGALGRDKLCGASEAKRGASREWWWWCM